MTMLAPEAESAIGLTRGQKAAAGLGAVPTAKTQHPYIVGTVLVLVGGFGLIGSITGTLPSMIAALFVPTALQVSADGSIITPPAVKKAGLNLNFLGKYGVVGGNGAKL